ncbi:MAG: glycoside hydrolase family 57 protein [Caldiserica bacterium]|nr:glycoside hydrolase family 57 protein [Caldisericota bacterium]
MPSTLAVCFVWHFHQPQYQDLSTPKAVLPWARLHCARNYTMMLHLLEAQPAAHVTINLTPVLAAQLDAFANETCTDEWLQLSVARVTELDMEKRSRLLAMFFDVNQQRIVEQDSRYHQLSLHRSDPIKTWSEQELRDLQCLFMRAWTDSSALAERPEGTRLLSKVRDFTEEDHDALVRAQHDLVRDFLPRLAALCRSGQVELATSPYAHPILPLLIDTDTAAAVQDTPLPHPAFRHPEDALRQLQFGRHYVEQLLGLPISGCWPSEGSVSPEAVAEMARAGFSWTATDEDILLRELPGKPRSVLYHPYRVRTTAGDIAMIFRDRMLSDAIGFQYASMTTDDAVSQFMRHVRGVKASLDQPGMLSIIMDGENAWEFYPRGGVPFLQALYAALADESDVRLMTVSEALKGVPASDMPAFRPGSWIDGNFRVWIGQDEDNKSWQYLRNARDDWGHFTPEEQDRSLLSMFAAEGSDWNWWYGRERTAETSVQFDDLYRRHLTNVYTQAGHLVPDQLLEPVLDSGQPVVTVEPTGLMNPRIDGGPARYLEWSPGRCFRPDSGGGAMNSGVPAVTLLRIGYSLSAMYLLIQLAPEMAATEDLRVEVRLSSHAEMSRFVIQRENGTVTGWTEPPGDADWALQKTLQIKLPFTTIRAQRGERVTFAVLVSGGGRLVATIPARGVMSMKLPDADYELQHWEV